MHHHHRSSPTQAVVLAGGQGSRLRPYTDDRPTFVDADGNPIQPKGKGGNTGGGGGKGGGGKGGGKGGNQTPQPVPGSTDELVTAVQNALDSASSSGGAINSIIDLRNTRVTLPRAADAPQNAPRRYVNSPLNDPNRLAELLPNLLDKVATKEAVEVIPRVNVNTAPREVLLGLPGLRQQHPAFALAQFVLKAHPLRGQRPEGQAGTQVSDAHAIQLDLRKLHGAFPD